MHENMSDTTVEKKTEEPAVHPRAYTNDSQDEEVGIVDRAGGKLHTDLKSRHMQMIAIGEDFPGGA